mmetsp:Transcript_15001/g.33868  ORF Transcript_15001/g.33868 Transcript_15001/m.33868 type:complete len:344 (-) Transcript_15001:362-1393(-)
MVGHGRRDQSRASLARVDREHEGSRSEPKRSSQREGNRKPTDSPKQVPPSSTGRAGGDSTLPIRLVDEDGTEVSNNVDNSEHESTAGNHREIRPLDVSCNGAASHLFLAAVIHEEGSLGSSIRRVDGLALLGCVANGLVEEIVHLVSRVNLDVDDSDHGDEDSEDDHRVQVRGHERGFQPSSRSVKDDSPGNQEGRELVVYSCQSLHSCGAAQKKHGRHDDVGAEPEEQERKVSRLAPASAYDLAHGMSGRGNILEADGEDSEDKNLDCGTGCIPERAADSILPCDIRRLKKGSCPGPLTDDDGSGQSCLDHAASRVKLLACPRRIRGEGLVEVHDDSGKNAE